MRVFGGRGQARNEEGNMIVITDYVPSFPFHRKTNVRFAQEPCVRHWTFPLVRCSISATLMNLPSHRLSFVACATQIHQLSTVHGHVYDSRMFITWALEQLTDRVGKLALHSSK